MPIHEFSQIVCKSYCHHSTKETGVVVNVFAIQDKSCICENGLAYWSVIVNEMLISAAALLYAPKRFCRNLAHLVNIVIFGASNEVQVNIVIVRCHSHVTT